MKGRLLGVDYGTVRVGLAITDPLGLTAQPFRTLQRRSDRQICRELCAIIQEKGVIEVVVGLPLDMSGETGPSAAAVEKFVERLRNHTSIPITLWDERLSTVQAERALEDSGVARSKRKQIVDQIAASLMLQAVLDSRPSTRDWDREPD